MPVQQPQIQPELDAEDFALFCGGAPTSERTLEDYLAILMAARALPFTAPLVVRQKSLTGVEGLIMQVKIVPLLFAGYMFSHASLFLFTQLSSDSCAHLC